MSSKTTDLIQISFKINPFIQKKILFKTFSSWNDEKFWNSKGVVAHFPPEIFARVSRWKLQLIQIRRGYRRVGTGSGVSENLFYRFNASLRGRKRCARGRRRGGGGCTFERTRCNIVTKGNIFSRGNEILLPLVCNVIPRVLFYACLAYKSVAIMKL